MSSSIHVPNVFSLSASFSLSERNTLLRSGAALLWRTEARIERIDRMINSGELYSSSHSYARHPTENLRFSVVQSDDNVVGPIYIYTYVYIIMIDVKHVGRIRFLTTCWRYSYPHRYGTRSGKIK